MSESAEAVVAKLQPKKDDGDSEYAKLGWPKPMVALPVWESDAIWYFDGKHFTIRELFAMLGNLLILKIPKIRGIPHKKAPPPLKNLILNKGGLSY